MSFFTLAGQNCTAPLGFTNYDGNLQHQSQCTDGYCMFVPEPSAPSPPSAEPVLLCSEAETRHIAGNAGSQCGAQFGMADRGGGFLLL